jgi:hypothetical protein
MSELQNIIERVKKLLALGESDNPNEAQNALSAAHSLMQKYRISVTEMEMKTGIKEEIINEKDNPVFIAGRIPGWKTSLLATIAQHSGCAAYKNRKYKGETSLHLVGRESDINITRCMYEYASKELIRLADGYCKNKGHRFYDSWFLGAIYGIDQKLKETEKNITEECKTSAIVLVNNRHQEANDFMYDNMKMGKPTRSNSHIDGNAFKIGHFVGKNDIDLNVNNKISG